MKNLASRPNANGSAHAMAQPTIKILGVLALALGFPVSLLLGAPVPEQPVASFRWGGGASSNMASAARNLPADPGNTAPLWEIKTGTHQYSIPTVDRGRILIAANDAGIKRAGYEATSGGGVMCVAQATGNLIWQLPIPRYMDGVKAPYHFDQWNCGVCSGPVVDGNRVYVVGSRGEILCLDLDGQANGNDGPCLDELAYMGITNTPDAKLEPTDGDIVWKFNLIPELGVILHDVCGSTLLLDGDLLYACTSNGIDDRHDQIPKPDAPSLIVLDKNTGRLVAKDDAKIGRRMFHCNWSSPVAGSVNGRTLIYFGGGDGILYAFDPPSRGPDSEIQILKQVWTYDCNPPDFRQRDGQPIPYSKATKNRPDGPSEIIGTPVFHAGRIYVAIGQSPIHGVGRGCFSCVDAATGQKVWTSELIDRTTATAAIADGLVYLPDYTGNLHCFDADTGQRYWVHPLEDKTWCASAFVADGKVYAGTETRNLWVLRAGKELQVLSRSRLKSIPSTPTAADGVLYLPLQNRLLAVPGKPTE
ncbi:MAG: PQQ-binding-like beta-propeller repeat protein [Akkermansiaceae bacterium]|nr:PQQ-binding-like beta-propeller repeat protein [Akkermansiaceae bacterium]MCF7730288.1 PQQ-binding-like beta-propeller repeat protein [Akkermansiaceae bacterium]